MSRTFLQPRQMNGDGGGAKPKTSQILGVTTLVLWTTCCSCVVAGIGGSMLHNMGVHPTSSGCRKQICYTCHVW